MNQVRLSYVPVREENPVQMADVQVQKAMETIEGDRKILSRGQRKRL